MLYIIILLLLLIAGAIEIANIIEFNHKGLIKLNLNSNSLTSHGGKDMSGMIQLLKALKVGVGRSPCHPSQYVTSG
mgnify:CR=1 FL=1